MKFIHTSDWHIGRQFHNVSLLEDQRHVLNQLVEHIQREAVDAVVIAGDVYDRSVPPAAAVELLDEVLNRICNELGVPVLLIPGNHDSAERLRFGSRQLRQAGLHIIGELNQINEPIKIAGCSLEVHFYGIPYNDPETVRNQFGADVSTHDAAHRHLVEQIINAKAADTHSILISHCFIDGWDESDSERPLSIGGADRISYEAFVGFDYVALGHLHGPQHKGEAHNRISLQRFVLSVLLDDVLIQASQRLHIMSNGRYQLVRKEDRSKGNKASGLDLEVEDSYTGKNRPVATLSGGESFMAALSLALGLSDVVQSYAGGIKLDTLFIDEGFGSLDPESLDLAIRTLIDLQATGRMIGIISHVSELKEQMALRLDVISSKNGSSIRTVSA